MKNKLILFTLLVILCYSCRQDVDDSKKNFNTQVFGLVKNAPDSLKIFLSDFYFRDNGGFVDSTYVVDNKFKFDLNLDEPRLFQINGEGSSSKHLIISQGNTELLVNEYDSINRLSFISSSNETIENEDYFIKYGYERDLEYLKDHKESFISLTILWEERYSLSTDQLEDYYNMLSTKWKHVTISKDIEQLISNNYTPEIGSDFLDFSLRDKNENNISLSDFKGKYLLIEFTASWCAPCTAQLPYQKRAYEKYKDKDFEILHIYLEDKEAMIKNTTKHSTPWNTVYASKKFRAEIAMLNRVNFLPNMFLLNKEHKIIGTTLNPVLMFDELEKSLEKNIK